MHFCSGSASAKTDHHNNLLDVPEHEATTTTDSAAAAAASGLVAAPRLGDLGRRFSLGMSMKAGFMSGKNNPPIGAGSSVDFDASFGDAGGASVKQSIKMSTGALSNDVHALTWNDPTGHEDSWEASGVHNSAKYSTNEDVVETKLLTDTTTAKSVPIYIGVISAENLPSGTDITCTIEFNGYVVQSMSNTSTQDNYMTAKVEFYAQPVVCLIPPGLPLAACTLSVTLTRVDTHHKATALATLTLRGSGLVNFLRKGKQIVDLQRSLPLAQTTTAFSMLTNADHHSAHAESGLKACKMEVIASYRPIKQEKYELHILSARNLPKADVFGSRYGYAMLCLELCFSRVSGTTVDIRAFHHRLFMFSLFPAYLQ